MYAKILGVLFDFVTPGCFDLKTSMRESKFIWLYYRNLIKGVVMKKHVRFEYNQIFTFI